MKIAIIGPVYPYKGGIAHYTGLMCKNLRKEFEVTLFSFRMQYPKFMYRKPQKDYENDTFRVEGTEYIIHTANPINWKKTARYINSISPDLVIFQWWHPYFAPCYSHIIKYLSKTKVLFLCHNVFPHERFPLDKKLTRKVLNNGDCFIVQSEQDAQDLLSIKKDALYKKVVHPTYNAFKFQDMSKKNAREILCIDQEKKVLLFFGFVREYKGLKHLISALPSIVEKYIDIKLLIVGDFGNDKDDYNALIEKSGCKTYIDVYDGYIPDKEVEKFFAASDLVVLPYESATQSGIVQIAYGFNKPVIATDVGGLPEVVIHDQTGYIVPPRQPEQLAQAVIRFFSENRAAEFAENVKKEAYKYDWDRMNEIVCELMGNATNNLFKE